MGAQPVIPVELEQLAQQIVDRQAGSFQNQLFELGALIKPPKNMRGMPATRFSPNYLPSLDTTKATQLVGRREDRFGVLIINLNATLANRLWIGTKPNITAAGSTAFPIPGGTGAALNEVNRLWLPVQDDVWAITSVANHEVAWMVFDWDELTA